MAGYDGRKRLIAIAESSTSDYAVFGAQQSFEASSEREEIDAASKFDNHNKTLVGQQSDNLSFESIELDVDEADAAQDLLQDLFDRGKLAYFEEGRWDGEDTATYEPVRRNSGYINSYERSASMNEVVTFSSEITLQEKWTKIGLTVTPASATIASTGSQQLTVTDAGGGDQTTSATYSSSDTGVATVTSAGLVSGVAAGEAIITATFNGVSGRSTITVTA